jgi:hypothetical protein
MRIGLGAVYAFALGARTTSAAGADAPQSRQAGPNSDARLRSQHFAGTPERGAVLAQVRNLLEFARQRGYGHLEIIQMISDVSTAESD